ncbi:MAG: hypothetical protein A2806_00605 [Candidatus Terrybacteria bacterium RIFCSPHIGHO2_01_FULL_48_17]|uniref:NIF system FeS cluster assembly NifU N-terminal domain-containing protein n=1 Tax=Candidatus Terrybacteria bacterium RIFCSPHIGHO2_01_FULL_48_17 TaxID=1802362 RepID=A0A1G2PIF5_9BACT|nr:MAG: hypothetical protein A2806_00605 [Candidatus Terrybacteria bacterium RIFCSPHIGHO2_01_FULL_48_17]OHA53843.1 MAG: hypothetical protein A3A30_01200 [Candidatus Terrybacteria bacterium RIFCSPLOWO2_01_FULL_48_14]
MSSLYREEILAHARHPQHRGTLEPADIIASLTNTTCGDEITIYIKTKSPSTNEQIIDEVRFEGEGCIISQAAADLFSEYITGKTLKNVSTMTIEGMLSLFNASITESRKPCALLAYEALKRKTQRVEYNNQQESSQ